MNKLGCSESYRTDEYHGWGCKVTGGACVFLIPSSKACADMFWEGPDAVDPEEDQREKDEELREVDTGLPVETEEDIYI